MGSKAFSTRVLALLGLAGLALLFAATAPAATQAREASILVKFAKPVAAATRLLPGDRLLGRTLNGVAVIRVRPGADVTARIARYKALPGVRYAELNATAKAQALGAPNDTGFGSQWAYGVIRAIDGWSIYPGSYTSGGGVTIGIVDTGVDSSHPDLSDGRILPGANCVTPSGTCAAGPALDDNGHGTHVAGIAAAATNNGTGVAGTAYSSHLLPVKVLDSTGQGSYAAITNGIIWASQNGARVENVSIGGAAYSQTLCDAITQAENAGTLVVASAGNNGNSVPNYPAACPGAVGVAATDSSDKPASFSNSGSPDVFVSAPGVSIYSTYMGGGYQTMSGTSMAAPFVTGLSALLFGEVPSRGVSDVKSLLATSANKVGSGTYGADPYGTCGGCTWTSSYGYGRIDVYAALNNGDFNVGASPSSASTPQTGSVTYNVSVGIANGWSGDVDLSVTGLPLGTNAKFSPNTVAAPGSAQLQVHTSAATPTGSYTLTIKGSSGGTIRATSVTLVVTSLINAVGNPVGIPISAPSSDFSISSFPTSRTVLAGEPAPYALTLSAQGNFGGIVDLSVSGLPGGTTAVFAPPTTSAPGASALTVLTTPDTPAGTYWLTVTGTSGGHTHSITLTLYVK